MVLGGAQVLTISDNLSINFKASNERTTKLKSGKLSLIRSLQLCNFVLSSSNLYLATYILEIDNHRFIFQEFQINLSSCEKIVKARGICAFQINSIKR